MPPKKQKVVPPAKPLPAEGSGGKKRTPQSAFDPAKGQQTYEPCAVERAGLYVLRVTCYVYHGTVHVTS